MNMKFLRLLVLIVFAAFAVLWAVKVYFDVKIGVSAVLLIVDVLCTAAWSVGFVLRLKRYRDGK